MELLTRQYYVHIRIYLDHNTGVQKASQTPTNITPSFIETEIQRNHEPSRKGKLVPLISHTRLHIHP